MTTAKMTQSATMRFHSGTASIEDWRAFAASWWLTPCGGASVEVAAVSAAVWLSRVAADGCAVRGAFRLLRGFFFCVLYCHRIQTEMTMPPAATANAGWNPNLARTHPAMSGAVKAPTLMPM